MKKFISQSIVFTGILLASITCNAMDLIELSGNEVFVPEKLGSIKVLHNDKGFKIMENKEIHDVQNCFVDKEIRNLSNEQLAYFLGTLKDVEVDGQLHKLIKVPAETIIDNNNEVILNELNNKEAAKLAALLATTAYLSVGKMSNGEYSIQAKTRLPGGGPGGATAGFWVVRAGISVLGHGTLAVISSLAGPAAGPGVFVGLETTFGPMIESAANVGGLAAGIVTGVATGPM
jgi:hypothetical protein